MPTKKEPVGEPPQPIIFSYKEVVEALLKHRRIKGGIWQLYVEFALGAVNALGPQGRLTPTAVIPVTKLGVRPVDNVNDLSVDASTIHPAIPAKKPKPAKKS